MLQIVDIAKSFSGQTALEKVRLQIEEGEFFSLLGPSGCGKTTLLRILAGLETPTSGEILLDGRRIDTLSPQQRPFNMVFQRYALFPHLTVAENIAFGLRMKKLPAGEVRTKVEKVLDMVGLKNFSQRRPETLSGGQQQRVAVARALVNEPRVLLLDEPLSALDQKMREHMQTELRALQRRLGLTFIYVTHDQEEAFVLSDRIGVMHKGYLEQVSAPRELYENPRTHFAAQFVGQASRLCGELVSLTGGMATLRLKDQTLIRGRVSPEGTFKIGHQVTAFVRPERVDLLPTTTAPSVERNTLQGRLLHAIFRGDHTEVHVENPCGDPVMAFLSGEWRGENQGSNVRLCFAPEFTSVFGDEE